MNNSWNIAFYIINNVKKLLQIQLKVIKKQPGTTIDDIENMSIDTIIIEQLDNNIWDE